MKTFGTVEAHLSYVRRHMERQAFEKPFDAKAHAILLDLIDQSATTEISHFYRWRYRDGYFVAMVLSDGTELDCDFIKAVYRAHPNENSYNDFAKPIIQAFQHEVERQTKWFLVAMRKKAKRDGHPGFFQLKRDLLPERECCVGHKPQFPLRRLIVEFLHSANLRLLDTEIIPTNSGSGYQLVSRYVANRWYAYHRQHAKLQVMPVSQAAEVALPLFLLAA